MGQKFFNEMFDEAGEVRPLYAELAAWLKSTPIELLRLRSEEAEAIFRRLGITFAVYGEGGDPERLIPFDVLPRLVAAEEWRFLERGLEQRVRALNAFLADVYHHQEILKAGKIPKQLILQNPAYTSKMEQVSVPNQVYTHIAGIDMVRVGPDEFYVLEDNVRTPSGVSYMLENREASLRLIPELLGRYRIAPVEHYAEDLLATLQSVPPHQCQQEPTVVVLSPGVYNSAYYEHSFLADQMGVELVEGADLFVQDDLVYMRTTLGPKRVDVIYRRIDDAYLDPRAFRPESMLGVPGLMECYRLGNVNLANAVGTGIADDKAIYTHVPTMIRFYLGEEPLLRNVPTWQCSRKDELQYVLEHLEELVVKEVHGSGGYGMLVGPTATKDECELFRQKLKSQPEVFVAQPTLALSACPTLVEEGIAPRHVDLRPFVLSGASIKVVPGGLTRVALRDGSLVVNSSQGGGTKDTWVLQD
ncbi:MAG: circularly permuted type 2 ATP-grasp protein [bacterium]